MNIGKFIRKHYYIPFNIPNLIFPKLNTLSKCEFFVTPVCPGCTVKPHGNGLPHQHQTPDYSLLIIIYL